MRYSDFLKDKRFIQWQLFSDSSLNEYWMRYIEENPENIEAIQQAIQFLKTKGAGKELLSNQDKGLLKTKIELSLNKKIRQNSIKFFYRLAFTACVAAIVFIFGFYFLKPSLFKFTDSQDSEMLAVGNILENKDIQVVSGSKTVNFNNDIQVIVNENGKAHIVNADDPKNTIEMDATQTNKIIVPYGKRSQISLQDGSKVWLNSGTVLEFQSKFTKGKREIKLHSGEIYVEVTPDKSKPFYVQTPDFNIRVYGTKFNVSNYSKTSQSVVLVEGSIGLSSKNVNEIKLTPNEQAILTNNNSFVKNKVNSDVFVSWTAGYLVFDKTPIEEVLIQIARYYNLSFDYGTDINLKKRTCTGKIYLSDNLDDVMQTIALLSSTEYEKKNNKIYIANKKPTDAPMNR